MPDPLKNWDRQLEGGLPESRLGWNRRESTTIQRGRMTLERVFCANCGCDGGGVTPEWAAHVFYLCDKCAEKYGNIDGVTEVPEAVVRGQKPLV